MFRWDGGVAAGVAGDAWGLAGAGGADASLGAGAIKNCLKAEPTRFRRLLRWMAKPSSDVRLASLEFGCLVALFLRFTAVQYGGENSPLLKKALFKTRAKNVVGCFCRVSQKSS